MLQLRKGVKKKMRLKLKEVWNIIPGFRGYEASNMGRIRSYWLHDHDTGIHGCLSILSKTPIRILKYSWARGRLIVCIKSDRGEHRTFSISRLVAMAFIDRDITEGVVVHHINKNPKDNRPFNLQVLTPSEHFSIHRGKHKERNKKIRSLISQGYNQTEVAQMFKVSQPWVSHIVRN